MAEDKNRSNEPQFELLAPSERARVMDMIKRGVTRRDMVKWMVAAGASASTAGSIFVGAKDAFAQTPKRGGKLIMGFDAHGPADTLDPALATQTIDYFRSRMFYGSLTRLTEKLTYEPELAEEITANGNATEWTFKIRKGVEFHDGKTLNADDVVYSMNRHLGKDSPSKGAVLVTMIKEWRKVNDYEVKAILDAPNADLPIALSLVPFRIIKNGQTDFSTTVGTGPYKVKEFKPGVRAIGSRFNNYWAEGGYLDELETFAIGDPVARTNAFLAGDIDAMQNLPSKSIDEVRAAKGKEIWSLKTNGYISIINRLDMQPSGNMDLVRAIQLLVDRDRLIKGVYKGEATFANDQPIGPLYPDHCPDIPQRMLDPEKARYHFKKSGIGNTKIQIAAAEIAPGAMEQALFLQREAANIGLNIDVQRVPTQGYYASVWMKSPISVGSTFMRPTANMILSVFFQSNATWNESYWKNEKFDQTLIAVRGVTDPAKRKSMYCDLQTMIHEGSGLTIPLHRNFIDAVASHVKGRTNVPMANFGGAECPPYLWRDA